MYVREPAPEDFDIASGHIPKGSAAALRFEVFGMVDGDPVVVLEHVTRLREDLCPDWPQPAQPGGSYRIEITGEPSYAMDVCLSSRRATTTTPDWWPPRCGSSMPSRRSSPPRPASSQPSTCHWSPVGAFTCPGDHRVRRAHVMALTAALNHNFQASGMGT